VRRSKYCHLCPDGGLLCQARAAAPVPIAADSKDTSRVQIIAGFGRQKKMRKPAGPGDASVRRG
jgi:hypothetical protein